MKPCCSTTSSAAYTAAYKHLPNGMPDTLYILCAAIYQPCMCLPPPQCLRMDMKKLGEPLDLGDSTGEPGCCLTLTLRSSPSRRFDEKGDMMRLDDDDELWVSRLECEAASRTLMRPEDVWVWVRELARISSTTRRTVPVGCRRESPERAAVLLRDSLRDACLDACLDACSCSASSCSMAAGAVSVTPTTRLCSARLSALATTSTSSAMLLHSTTWAMLRLSSSCPSFSAATRAGRPMLCRPASARVASSSASLPVSDLTAASTMSEALSSPVFLAPPGSSAMSLSQPRVAQAST
mmetsp:Transcript_16581/g.35876  ORF Transcript_16581/g.35876 Transcript_16581/m.35876 type:complete len:295 (-) Transcript_16581:2701-3585(-)